MSKGALSSWRSKYRSICAATVAALIVAACKTAPTPVPVDPGPPPTPRPPLGAAHGIYIPPADPETGERKTPNSDIDSDETIWHFRSVFNVAALNCVQPRWDGMTGYYNSFLRNSSKPLDRVNRSLDARFKAAFPAVNGLRVRDTHTTEIYNYFSLPPTMDLLCDLLYSKAPQATLLTDDQLYPYSKQVLAELDAIFIKFYEDYEDYLRRLAEWEALYGRRGIVIVGGDPLYGPTKPEAVSERTGASFDDMPAERPTLQPALPPSTNGLPSGYQPSAGGSGD